MQSVSETIKTQLKCISILANSNHLLLQFFFFFPFSSFFILQRMHTDNICREFQLLNAFQNQLYGPLLYLPILFWIFKRKHYYHFNIPSKRPSALFFSRLKIHSPKSFYLYFRLDLFHDFFVIEIFRPCSTEGKLSIKQLQTV